LDRFITAHVFPTESTSLKCSGAGQWRRDEFESGGGAPVRRESRGHLLGGRVPQLFFSKRTISRFGERFCDGQYSLVSFLFAVLLLTVPPVPSHL